MSVFWVKETVNANVVGTVDTFADPFGIQAAFDNALAGDDIHILVGTNNYNSSSSSWTGRDATDRTINVDGANGTQDLHIGVFGFASESVKGQAILDFDSGVITGDDGFNVTADHYIWDDITVEDCDVHGWDLASTAAAHVFQKCRSRSNGGFGWQRTNLHHVFSQCEANGNTSGGWENSGFGIMVACEAHDNSGDGFEQGGPGAMFLCVADGNTGAGWVAGTEPIWAVNCTIHQNTSFGVNISGGKELVYLFNNGITGHNGAGDAAYSIAAGSRLQLVVGSAVPIGGGAEQNTAKIDGTGLDARLEIAASTLVPNYANAGTRDYSPGTNWKELASPGLMPSGDSTTFLDMGALQREEPAGGAGGIAKLAGDSGGLVG